MRRAEIRRRVKRHIKNRGTSDDFIITESFCLYWWRYLNEAIFDGKLTQPVRFEIRKFRKDCGWCRPYAANRKEKRVVIGINSSIWDRKSFLEVLGHEMVHQWEWEVLQSWKDSDPVHGKQFYDWTGRLASRAGLTLSASYDI